MTAYLLRRLLSLSLSLVAASLVIFLVMEVVPGDPASFMMGINADPQAVAALRSQLGLDEPLPVRYLGWVAGLLQGDFGISYTYRVPVSELIAERVMISLPLTLYALALSTLIAFPAGILAASRRNSAADLSVMGATQLGVAIPNFWFAMILVLVFAINLRWFSAGGFPGWDAGFLEAIKALTLPAIALALPQASILARVMRSSLIDTLNEDFMRTARAKGLSRGQALRRHALRNALIPVLTIIGLQFSFLLAGGIIIENVFYLPGLGRLAFQAITQRDLIVVRSVVILLVFAVIVVTFLVDLAYAAADPRLRRRRT
ncbi:ABC transporter permease [uncultured Hoeflea sp.]|mgnify:CR=1 FL=1|uniref:ABC transporter permease n=1 Tax=uncultured Hoeflea sp. TaxID=538666 RepID=UPI0030EECBDB|tara:strand:+ start:169531 stop:170481 length:951 start_codon:yes stop_codon:yes gene_type:complete